MAMLYNPPRSSPPPYNYTTTTYTDTNLSPHVTSPLPQLSIYHEQNTISQLEKFIPFNIFDLMSFRLFHCFYTFAIQKTPFFTRVSR